MREQRQKTLKSPIGEAQAWSGPSDRCHYDNVRFVLDKSQARASSSAMMDLGNGRLNPGVGSEHGPIWGR
ncbi:hypothetical protein PanWU01x14_099820 [Parasponia andersonii]|uniref:Uncharacterized protein n=1 Tax=Parasponia andersonii TaxID=3476 RepID=A0A2P5D3F2_PARAD|nr:hypothetical protein PanWU01x14_099820 [Parasponia andersonii]